MGQTRCLQHEKTNPGTLFVSLYWCLSFSCQFLCSLPRLSAPIYAYLRLSALTTAPICAHYRAYLRLCALTPVRTDTQILTGE